MNLEEFRANLITEWKAQANNGDGRESDLFISDFSERLADAEELTEYNPSFFQGSGRNNRLIQIEGYTKDDADKSYSFIIADYDDGDAIKNLVQANIDKLVNRVMAFIEFAVDGYILQTAEISSLGYAIANDLRSDVEAKLVNKINIVILTNKKLSQRVKAQILPMINDISIVLDIYDIEAIFRLEQSTQVKEKIEVQFPNSDSLSVVLAAESIEEGYKSYLGVINGKVLAELYLRYGARLLEGNVRSFLSNRTKINKGIRNTIKNEPAMFFAYNNGIAATASDINIIKIDGESKIIGITDFQIINGGQTTASLANALAQEKLLVNLEKISVPLKLSVVENHQKLEVMVPNISRTSNSQNKIDEADFFSNHEFHVRMEEYSRKIYAPKKSGEIKQKQWFYERARGQYNQQQIQMTQAEKKRFSEITPKNHVIKKVELAKYMLSYYQQPDLVSKGAQSCMRSFAGFIENDWEKKKTEFNELYFKKMVSLAILFKETERQISQTQWYKEVKAYRANIVTYSIAVLFYSIQKKYSSKELDFKYIWNRQELFPELINQIEITTKEVFDFITDNSRATLNVTEWCKKKACWDRAQNIEWTIDAQFINSLISKSDIKAEEKEAIGVRKVEDEVDEQASTLKMAEDGAWTQILKYGTEYNLLTEEEKSLIRSAANSLETMKIPTPKQSKKLLSIRDRLIYEGMDREKYE